MASLTVSSATSVGRNHVGPVSALLAGLASLVVAAQYQPSEVDQIVHPLPPSNALVCQTAPKSVRSSTAERNVTKSIRNPWNYRMQRTTTSLTVFTAHLLSALSLSLSFRS